MQIGSCLLMESNSLYLHAHAGRLLVPNRLITALLCIVKYESDVGLCCHPVPASSELTHRLSITGIIIDVSFAL